MKLFKCIACGSNAVDEIILENKISFKCYSCGHIRSRAHTLDGRIKTDVSSDGKQYHFTVSLVIKSVEGEFLLSQRRAFPFAWALVAGHVHNGETPLQTAQREMLEETGLFVSRPKRLFAKMSNNPCRRGADRHMIYAYEIIIPKDSFIVTNHESQSLVWVSARDLEQKKYMPLAQGAEFVLRELGVAI